MEKSSTRLAGGRPNWVASWGTRLISGAFESEVEGSALELDDVTFSRVNQAPNQLLTK